MGTGTGTETTGKRIPQSSYLRTLADLAFGGHFSKGLGVQPLFDELRARHKSDVFGLHLDTWHQFVVVCDPDDWLSVLRAEWTQPRGVAPLIWPPLEALKALGFREDDPDPAKRISFVMSVGRSWQVGRTLYQSEMFRQSKVDDFVPAFAVVADDACAFIESKRPGTPTLNDFTSRIAFEMLCVAMLGIRLGLLSQTEMPLGRAMVDKATEFFLLIGMFRMLPPAVGKLHPKWKRAVRLQEEIIDVGTQLVRAAHDAKADGVVTRVSAKNTKIPELQLSSELAQLLSAGVDTTANVLGQVLWCLARYPHAQEKLREEINAVLGKDQPVTAEALAQMHYLRAVMREQHRLHVPIMGSLRKPDAPVLLKSGYVVPANAMTLFSSIQLHLDPQHVHGDPLIFAPERWLDKSGAFDRFRGGGHAAAAAAAATAAEMDRGEDDRDAKASGRGAVPTPGEKLTTVRNYRDLNHGSGAREVDVFAPSLKIKHPIMETPFGVGPRQCLGGRMASTEISCAVVALVRRYELRNSLAVSEKEDLFRHPHPDPGIVFVPV